MGSSRGHIPIRTCIVCGAKGNKFQLVRLVWEGEGLVKDRLGRKPGRGAYVCPAETCSGRLSKRKGLRKILKPARERQKDPAGS